MRNTCEMLLVHHFVINSKTGYVVSVGEWLKKLLPKLEVEYHEKSLLKLIYRFNVITIKIGKLFHTN